MEALDRKAIKRRATDLLAVCRRERVDLGLKAASDEWQDEQGFETERVARDVLTLLELTAAKKEKA